MRKKAWLTPAAIVLASLGAGIAVGSNGATNKKTFQYAHSAGSTRSRAPRCSRRATTTGWTATAHRTAATTRASASTTSGSCSSRPTRVETFGDNQTPAGNTNDVMWVKALVDPQSRDVFAFQPEIVPENYAVTSG